LRTPTLSAAIYPPPIMSSLAQLAQSSSSSIGNDNNSNAYKNTATVTPFDSGFSVDD
jgi:hypothetical protein